ncbi:Copia protein, partial [Mucuna pruriens]
MLCENSLLKHFWIEVVSTTRYVQNRILIRHILEKTPYKLWRGRISDISFFHLFGCKCFLLNIHDHVGNFDSKVDKGIFLGYLDISKAYRVFNLRALVVKESTILFDACKTIEKHVTDHPQDLILGNKSEEPKNIGEALKELHRFTKNNIWKLVPRFEHKSIIVKYEILETSLMKMERLEAIRILLAFATYKDIKLFQMNKRNFFKQPLGFEDTKHLDHVFKLKKALYGLKQTPYTWYDILNIFHIHVDDIIFGATNECLCKNFFDLIQSEGELMFFLGIQVKQEDKDI